MPAALFSAPTQLAVIGKSAFAAPPLTPEATAALTPLVLMRDNDAAQVLRRRSPPAWLQIYIGMVITTTWKSRGQAGPAKSAKKLACHATYWVWLERTAALETMAVETKQGVSVIVAHVWVPVRAALGNPDLLELGQPSLDLFKGLCWKLLSDDLPSGPGVNQGTVANAQVRGVLRAEPGQDGFWHRHPERIAGRYPGSDARGWVEEVGYKLSAFQANHVGPDINAAPKRRKPAS